MFEAGHVLILHCERRVTDRARMLLAIFHADDSRAAGRAFPFVLTHSKYWTCDWQHDPQ